MTITTRPRVRDQASAECEAIPARDHGERRGAARLRELVPDTFDEGDPVPHRRVLFRIAVEEVTGRECIPAPTED